MKQNPAIGVYTRLNITKDPPRLPPNLLDILKNAIASGVLDAPSIWRKRIQIGEDDFYEAKQSFKQLSENNAALFHLLMSCYLKTIRNELKKKKLPDIKDRNCFIIGGMIQREMTQMCLEMHEDDLESSNLWTKYVGGIEENHEEWMEDYRGALAAARVARLLAHRKIKVYLPTAYTDIQLRIDLLACVPKKPFGLCVQVKNHSLSSHLHYHLFDKHETHPRREELHEDDCYFVNGVAYFSNQSIGSWIPIEIRIGDTAYETDTVIPPPSMIEALDKMLKRIYTPKTTTPWPQLSTPDETQTVPSEEPIE